MTGGLRRRTDGNRSSESPIVIAAVCGSEREALSLAPVTSAAAGGTHPQPIKILTVAMGRRAASGAGDILGFTPEYILPGPSRRRLPEPMHLGRIAHAVAPLLEELQPHVVAVAGDGWVPAAVALLGGYRDYSIVHVGAGMRHPPGRRSPGRGGGAALPPAETPDVYADYDGLPPGHRSLHRRLLASASALHMAPTAPAAANLLKEGVGPGAVHVTGHPIIDAMDLLRRELDPGGVAAAVGAGSRTPVLVSIERPAAPDAVINVCRAVRRVMKRTPSALAVVELPRCKISARLITRYLGDETCAVIVPPLGCLQRWSLLRRSRCAITTGGPLEEEGPYFGVPVLVAAAATDRPELAELGLTSMVGDAGPDLAAALASVFERGRRNRRQPRRQRPGGLFRGEHAGARPRRPLPPGEAARRHPYGDGRASRRILQAILYSRGLAPKPAPFAGIARS